MPHSESKLAIASVRRTLSVVFPLMLLCLMGLPDIAWTQGGERPVTDLTNEEVTAETLVDALRPQVKRPLRARGLTSAPSSCSKFRKQMNRGIRPVPVSEKIALTIEFASDSAKLTPGAREELDKLGAAFEDPLLEDCCFHVEGHTDSQHTETYNQRLSEARAQSVVDYVSKSFNVDRDRLLQQGFGEMAPLTTNETAEGRQKNRRVQVSNLGYRTAEGGP